MKLIKQLSVLLAVLIVAISSCVKQDFDAPPDSSQIDPGLVANTTIAQLRALYTSGAPVLITDDKIIAGIVIADDRSGNFYKQIIIQDATAGILINIDATSLYNDYPVGRKVYVKCKGLYIGAYSSMVQLGAGIDASNSPASPDRIPQTAIPLYVVKGPSGQAVTPKIVRISQLNNTYQSQLIQIVDAEFDAADLGKPYSDPSTVTSGSNRNVKSCSGGAIIMRNSAYSNFASQILPNGNGVLTAVYTVFGSTKQLVIRDPSDVQFTGTRCPGFGQGVISIRTVRNQWGGTNQTVAANTIIRGIVISDRTGGNTNSSNIVVTNTGNDAGIVVRFAAPHSFNVGDSVEINLATGSLSEFNSLLQVQFVPLANATLKGTGFSLAPRVTTVSNLVANGEDWESTLVKINNATVTGTGTTWNGTTNINDGTSIQHFTNAAATFSGATLPAGNKNFTCIVSQFGSARQVYIRTLADVQ